MRLQGNQIQEGFQLPCGGVSFSSTEQQGDLKSKANTNSGETPGCEETSYCHRFHYEGMRMKEKSPLFLFQAHLHQTENTRLFPSSPVSCVSFLVVLESFCQYPEGFSANGSPCRCIFDVFVVGGDLCVLLLCHLDLYSPSWRILNHYPLTINFINSSFLS